MTALLDATGVPDRFTAPLYTLAEASQFLGVSNSTFTSWARGYRKHRDAAADVVGAAILTTVPKPPPWCRTFFDGVRRGTGRASPSRRRRARCRDLTDTA
jgi:hypothetical protein